MRFIVRLFRRILSVPQMISPAPSILRRRGGCFPLAILLTSDLPPGHRLLWAGGWLLTAASVLRLVALGCVVCVAISAQAATIDWNPPAVTGTTAWATGTNWTNGTAPANSLTTDIARFNQIIYLNQPTTGTTNINGIINGGSANITIATATGTIFGIGGNGIVVNSGAGTTTFSGLGTLAIGASQSWANNSSSLLTISDSSITNIGNATPFTLTINGSGSGGTTISGIISNGGTTGTIALTINTTGGTTTLSGANTYTGGTTLTLGTLKLSGSGTLGGTSGALTVNGGTLDLNGTNQTVGALGGSGGTILNNNSTAKTLTVGQGGGTGSFGGVIADHTSGTGTVALTKTGTGTETFSGVNTYTGATTISGGTLAVSSLAAGGSNSNIGASTSAATNLVLNGGTLQYTGGAVSTNRLFSVGTSGGTLDASGSGAVNFTNTGSMGFNSQTGTRTLTLTGTNTGSNTLSAVIGDNGGATSLTKNATGNWVLGGANTYTGTTTVNGGDLSTGTFTLSTTATVSIASGATYTSTGTLNLNPDTTAAQTFISGAGTLRLRNSSSTASAPDIYYDPTGNSTSGSGFPVTIASNIDVGTGTRYFNGISQRDDYERYGGELIFSGNLSGSANLTFTGTPNTGIAGQTWQTAYTLAGNNSAFTGGIILTDGANLTLNNANALTSANSVTFTPSSGAVSGLYLYGRNVTIGALSGTAAGTMNIRNGSLVTDTNTTINPGIVRSNSVLTIQQDTNTTFNGIVSDGPNDHGSGDAGTYYTLGLTKTGSGTLTLTGANTYTGGTTINGGILALGADSGNGGVNQSTAANSLGTGAITIGSGAQLRFGGASGAVVNYTFSNNVTLNNGSIVVADGAQHLQGTFTVGSGGGTLTTQYSTKDLYFDGAVSGSGALTIDNLISPLYGDGQVHFTGSNSYSGTLTINNSSGSSDGGRIAVDSNNALANASIVMNGPRDIGFATTAPVFGALSGTGGITLTSGLNLSVGNNNTASIYSGVLTGPGRLTKVGTAAWTLTGANTYTGTTTVSAGSLFVNGSTAAGSAVTVNNSGTTLGGSGTIGGSVNVASSGANLSPGATGAGSTAILHTGALTLATGSNLRVDINGTTAGSGYDQLSVTGTVNLGLASNLLVTTATTLAVGQVFNILLNDNAAPIPDAISGTFAQGTTVIDNLGDVFTINYLANSDGGTVGNDISLTVLTTVPEPSTWTVGALALGAIICSQPKRVRAMLARIVGRRW
jgi:fibronectin-binding autotransporter adhesin